MVGEGVTAQERPGVVGARADRGDPERLGDRQRGARLQQHDRALGQVDGDLLVLRRVQVGELRVGHRRLRGPARVEQAQLGLLQEQAAGGPVDELLRHLAAADPVDEAGAVPDGVRQLDVDARFQGEHAGTGVVLGDAVHQGQERDRPVVRDDRAGEAPLVSQHLGEQPRVGAGRDTVDVGVGVHHRADATEPDSHLERRQHHVDQLPAAHPDRAVVAGAPRGRVAGEMLQGGDDATLLQTTDVRRTDHRDQVGVLADGLLDPPPPVVTHHVEHGGEPLVHAERGHVPPDRGRHPLDQLRVERGAPRDRGRVDGRAQRGEAGQALLVHQGRDAEPGRHHDALLTDQLGGALGRGERHAAVHPGQVAETVPGRLLQRHRAAGREDVLHRRDVVLLLRVVPFVMGVAHVVADPAAAQLRDLLLEGHLGKQCLDAIGDGQCRVVPRLGHLFCGQRVCGQALPPDRARNFRVPRVAGGRAEKPCRRCLLSRSGHGYGKGLDTRHSETLR